MTRSQSYDSTPVVAARLEALALRASLPQGSDVNQDSISLEIRGEQILASKEKAAEILATLPKPTICSASVDREYLTIKCEELLGDQLRSHELAFADLITGFRRLEGYPANLAELILVRSAEAALLLPAGVLEVWFRDYAIPDGVLITGTPPPREYLAKGAKYAFVFSRPTPIRPDSR